MTGCITLFVGNFWENQSLVNYSFSIKLTLTHCIFFSCAHGYGQAQLVYTKCMLLYLIYKKVTLANCNSNSLEKTTESFYQICDLILFLLFIVVTVIEILSLWISAFYIQRLKICSSQMCRWTDSEVFVPRYLQYSLSTKP